MKVKNDQKVDVLRSRFSSAEVDESLPILRARVGALALRSRGAAVSENRRGKA